MTFEEALKRLAEKEPEKFEYRKQKHAPNGELCQMEGFRLLSGYRPFQLRHSSGAWEEMTQDFIDAILAEIGWEYQVCVTGDSRESFWTAEVWKPGEEFDSTDEFITTQPLLTKLEAAKAALIAVVEREYPDETSDR